MDPLGPVIRQAGEHVGEPGVRVDVVELGSCDQRVDGGGAPATFVGACEGPVAAPERNGTRLALGSVVGHAQSSIIEEADERIPALEAVVDGPAGLAVFWTLSRACSRSHASNAVTSARLRSWRTSTRCCGVSPL